MNTILFLSLLYYSGFYTKFKTIQKIVFVKKNLDERDFQCFHRNMAKYNYTDHKSIGEVPFDIMFGKLAWGSKLNE